MHNKSIYIVGGGPSIQECNLSLLHNLPTIGVNKSVFSLTNPTHFITMDYTVLQKIGIQRLHSLRCSKFFAVNLCPQYMQVRHGAILDIRNNAVYSDIYQCCDSIILCKRERGFGASFHDFCSGNNSGYTAIQLALLLGYTRIYLIGMDLTIQGNHTHFHNGYGEKPLQFFKKLQGYTEYFIHGIQSIPHVFPDVRVFSCSPVSPLNLCIPFVSFTEAIRDKW
jgi:hypothetical protein